MKIEDTDQYLTISEESVGEGRYTEKRSKFLAFAFHVETADQVKSIVAEYRKKYYDARHCCYAYMLGAERENYRANDDGEPSSTAGKPILGQINAHNLTNVLVVVVRYYGGVNLGTGGLIVAYRTAAAEAIGNAKVVKRTQEATVSFDFTYPQTSAVMRIVNEMGARIVGQDFASSCSLTVAIAKSRAQQLLGKIEEVKRVTG